MTLTTFDAENRLLSSSSPAFSAAYGPDGLRVSKGTGSSTTFFLCDQDSEPIVEETYNSGTQSTTVTKTYGRTADGLRAFYTGGQASDLLYDPQGNLIQRQTANGFQNGYAVKQIDLFDAYGAVRQRAGVPEGVQSSVDSVGFGAQYGDYTDAETGMVFMMHRYYDPGKGRFINRDPIGYSGGQNLYGYAGGNPVNNIDPSGLSKDPMPNASSDWVRVSTALFIPMPEFVAVHGDGVLVTHKGDGRSFNYNTDADRVRVDFALNIRTGDLVQFPAHTGGSKMTMHNGYSEYANATITESISSMKTATGWRVSVKGGGCDPFYDVGSKHLSPPASFTAVFNISGTSISGVVDYRQFPSMEIYAYNSAYSSGHKFLFGYQPSGTVQHVFGVATLGFGEKYHARF